MLGLGDTKKRAIIWNQIKSITQAYSPKIVVWALQETHSTEELFNKWKFELGPDWYAVTSNGSSNSKGVCIISKTKIQHFYSDSEGRIVIGNIVTDTPIFIGSFYCPSNGINERVEWINELDWDLFEQSQVWIGGDWNLVTEQSGRHSVYTTW